MQQQHRKQQEQLIIPFGKLAGLVREEVAKMPDEELVRHFVEAGLIEGLSAPGLAKAARTVPAPPPSVADGEIEALVAGYLKGLGHGASSTEIAERIPGSNKERVVKLVKLMADRPAGAEGKIYRSGDHKYTRYATSKALARAASLAARTAA